MSDWLPLLALGGTIFVGAATQRVSGMGFALVASPFLVALLGPFEGILVINLFGGLASLLIVFAVWRQVELKRAALLLIPATIAAIPGAFVAHLVPSAILSTLVGGLVLLTLVGSFLVRDSVRLMGRGGAALAGSVSGFMNVTAGVGGPAISAYAIATRWPQREFAATVQVYFCALGAVSLAVKGAVPTLSWQEWGACTGSLLVGIGAGHAIARYVSAKAARALVVALAFVGAIVIIVKGIVELVGS
jgi:uncharacterized membrane protein YfcA